MSKNTNDSKNNEEQLKNEEENRISLTGSNGVLNDEELEEMEKDPEPIEYMPPFPLEAVAVGGVVAVIVILVALILLRGAARKTSDIIQQAKSEMSTEITTNVNIYSISDDSSVVKDIEKDYSDIVIKNINSVICWGDEYMAGSMTNDFSVPTYIARKISGRYTVFNAGCNNENINGIAERQGGVYLEVMPVVIPSDPIEVPVTIKNMYGEECNVHISNDKNGGLNPVFIANVEGTLTATGHGYTFKRTSRGDELRIAHPMKLNTKGSIDRQSDIQIIFVGKQQEYDTERLIETYNSMVDFMKPVVKAYIIVGIAEGTAEEQKEYEEKMTAEFGRHFINVREYLATYAMSELGMTPTEEDSQLMAKGCIPKSLKNEDNESQLTARANEAIAGLIYERLEELNII